MLPTYSTHPHPQLIVACSLLSNNWCADAVLHSICKIASALFITTHHPLSCFALLVGPYNMHIDYPWTLTQITTPQFISLVSDARLMQNICAVYCYPSPLPSPIHLPSPQLVVACKTVQPKTRAPPFWREDDLIWTMAYHIPIESSSSPLFNGCSVRVISSSYWLIKCAQHNRIQVDGSINVALLCVWISTILHRHQVYAGSILDRRFHFNSANKRAVVSPAKTGSPKLGNTVLNDRALPPYTAPNPSATA